jgi:hypothetical protein
MHSITASPFVLASNLSSWSAPAIHQFSASVAVAYDTATELTPLGPLNIPCALLLQTKSINPLVVWTGKRRRTIDFGHVEGTGELSDRNRLQGISFCSISSSFCDFDPLIAQQEFADETNMNPCKDPWSRIVDLHHPSLSFASPPGCQCSWSRICCCTTTSWRWYVWPLSTPCLCPCRLATQPSPSLSVFPPKYAASPWLA